MKSSLIAALVLGTIAGPALAQHYDRDGDRRGDYGWHDDRNGWDPAHSYRDDRRYRQSERRLARNDRVYRGGDGRYYCRRNDGTTGLVIGGLGGAAAGGLIGGDTLGALIGAGAGALLGRSVDRGNVHCR